jgi:hypothetical protein
MWKVDVDAVDRQMARERGPAQPQVRPVKEPVLTEAGGEFTYYHTVPIPPWETTPDDLR